MRSVAKRKRVLVAKQVVLGCTRARDATPNRDLAVMGAHFCKSFQGHLKELYFHGFISFINEITVCAISRSEAPTNEEFPSEKLD